MIGSRIGSPALVCMERALSVYKLSRASFATLATAAVSGRKESGVPEAGDSDDAEADVFPLAVVEGSMVACDVFGVTARGEVGMSWGAVCMRENQLKLESICI